MRVDGDLRSIFRARLSSRGHWISIETGVTEQGVSDVNVCLRGGCEVWIENKQTDGWTPAVRPGQVGFALARWRAGGRAVFAVRRLCAAGRRRAAADELYVVAGWAARELKVLGLRGVPPAALLGTWTDGPSRWNWDEVERALRCCRDSDPGPGYHSQVEVEF
jgi:hypothetical protein